MDEVIKGQIDARIKIQMGKLVGRRGGEGTERTLGRDSGARDTDRQTDRCFRGK